MQKLKADWRIGGAGSIGCLAAGRHRSQSGQPSGPGYAAKGIIFEAA